MPKTKLILTVPCNILLPDDGTKEKLLAISYYKGDKGKYADAARDVIAMGISAFESGLSASQRAQYEEILRSVQTQARLKKALRSDNPVE